MRFSLRRASAHLLASAVLGSTGSLVLAEDNDLVRLPPLPSEAVSGSNGRAQTSVITPPEENSGLPSWMTRKPTTESAMSEVVDLPPPAPGSKDVVIPLPSTPPAVVGTDCGPAACPNPWAKVPPVAPFPRLGMFHIPPDGCGFYTLLDHLRHRRLEKAPKLPYPAFSVTPPGFFDADYRYLEDPANTTCDWLDRFKRIHMGDCWMGSVGGEFRYRLMDEVNSRLGGLNNSYHLLRYRAYADLWYTDRLRLYAEFLGAESYGQRLAPLLLDRNPAEIQNLFFDYKMSTGTEGTLYARIGRQELNYGSQRLLSTLDWVNARRTFQGAKVFYQGERWNVDAFWVRPVVPNANQLDSWDDDQNFTGIWSTRKIKPGTTWDFYVMNLDQNRAVAVGANGARGGFNLTTYGTRLAGDIEGRLLYDFEGVYQNGSRVNQSVSAGAYTSGVGYRAKDIYATPTFWAYYDYASGDHSPGTGVSRTFNPLFPFGHYYLGFTDFVGRRNIHDFSMQLSMNPTKYILALIQYHQYSLDSRFDALYNAGNVPIRQSAAGTAGQFVGNALDLLVNVHATRHMDFMLGYSRFFAGDFIRNTGLGRDSDLYYFQYSYKW